MGWEAPSGWPGGGGSRRKAHLEGREVSEGPFRWLGKVRRPTWRAGRGRDDLPEG